MVPKSPVGADFGAGSNSGQPKIPLTAQMRSLLPGMQPAIRRVAEFILSSPSQAAYMSISALAKEAHTSETTVIRLCRELGLSGYSELRLALASELGGRSAQERQFAEFGDIAEGDSVQTAIEKVAYSDFRSVSDTLRALPLPTMVTVAERIAVAPRVEAYGIGASGICALDMQQKLHRLGRVCFAFTDPHVAYSSVVHLRPTDVAIAFSNSGGTLETVEWLRAAQATGATTVAVTNTPGSPVTRYAEFVLRTVALETSFRAGATGSRLAQLSMVDCLFIGAAQHAFNESIKALEATRLAVEKLQERRGSE